MKYLSADLLPKVFHGLICIIYLSSPWSSGPGPRLSVSGRGFDSHPGDQYVRTGNSQSLWDRVVG
jgi:hypothetical protein